MLFVIGLIVGLVPTVVTGWVAFGDLKMRRKLEISKQFVALFATANGRPVDGRDGVGRAEQLAGIQVIADFSKREKTIERAAFEGLSALVGMEPKHPIPRPGNIVFPDTMSQEEQQEHAKRIYEQVEREEGQQIVAEAARNAIRSMRIRIGPPWYYRWGLVRWYLVHRRTTTARPELDGPEKKS